MPLSVASRTYWRDQGSKAINGSERRCSASWVQELGGEMRNGAGHE